MRLAETKIREAIVHPEKLVRHEALSYFAGSFSRDAEVMPTVIQAIETFGRDAAFLYHHALADLVQTETTIEWAVRELHRDNVAARPYDSYFPNLSRLLTSADPRLLAPRAKDILEAPGFSRELVPGFHERLQMASWDAERCWTELESVCARSGEDEDWFDEHFNRAGRVVAALAPQGEKHIDRIMALLSQKLGDSAEYPMIWMQVLLVILAGEMRLEQAVPLIVMKLHELGEILSEECVEALGKIGTDTAAAAVAQGWREADFSYRLYATSALENIHSDTTVRACLDLLGQEEDLTIKTKLAAALLSQYTEEAIEPARQLVRQGYDANFLDLQRHLVTVSTTLGATFPELLEWKQGSAKKQALRERSIQETQRTLLAPPQRPAYAERELDKPGPFIHLDQPVGRNDPCPCGSGKKFKTCCLGRSKK